MYPVYEWVASGTTRQAAGCKHALFCCLLGWWPIFGLFGTAGMNINNRMGVDITKVLTMPPPVPGQPFDDSAIRVLNAALKRQGYAFLAFLVFLGLLLKPFLHLTFGRTDEDRLAVLMSNCLARPVVVPRGVLAIRFNSRCSYRGWQSRPSVFRLVSFQSPKTEHFWTDFTD